MKDICMVEMLEATLQEKRHQNEQKKNPHQTKSIWHINIWLRKWFSTFPDQCTRVRFIGAVCGEASPHIRRLLKSNFPISIVNKLVWSLHAHVHKHTQPNHRIYSIGIGATVPSGVKKTVLKSFSSSKAWLFGLFRFFFDRCSMSIRRIFLCKLVEIPFTNNTPQCRQRIGVF